MKHDELCSIAHNIADSLASGCSLMIGVHEMDLFGEAARSVGRFLEVDFLNGTVLDGQVSDVLADSIRFYAQALPALCARHKASISAFKELTVRYYSDHGSYRFVVTVRDESGRSSITEYGGIPGQRLKQIDELGRLRPKHITRASQASLSARAVRTQLIAEDPTI